tara:strand:+ start:288 stop:701 length:414 start_codon:yes stop_codon:yes gene_type:complete
MTVATLEKIVISFVTPHILLSFDRIRKGGNMDPATIGSVAALLAVVELTKFFLNFQKSQNTDMMLTELYESSKKLDREGRPPWKIPQLVLENQKDLTEVVSKIDKSQEKTARLLDELIKHLPLIMSTDSAMRYRSND